MIFANLKIQEIDNYHFTSLMRIIIPFIFYNFTKLRIYSLSQQSIFEEKLRQRIMLYQVIKRHLRTDFYQKDEAKKLLRDSLFVIKLNSNFLLS